MEHKKCRFAEGACGKAKILLASAIKSHYIFATALLLAAGAAVHFTGIELFQPAFAELLSAQTLDSASTPTHQQVSGGNSYYRSMSESMSVTASYGSGSSTNQPVTYYRSITESMSVSTVQGKAPNSYSRSMSEQASVSAGMPSSAPAAGQPVRASAMPYSASSSQRIDERISLRNLTKADPVSRSGVAGTSIHSADSSMSSYELSGSDAVAMIQDIASVDSGESESELSSLASILAANLAAEQYQAGYSYANFVFSMQGMAVVALSIGRSAAARKVARASDVRILVAVFSSTSEKPSAVTRALIIIVVLLSVSAVSSSGGPIFGQAAGDTNKAGTVYIEGSTPVYREWIPLGGGGGSWSSAVSLTPAETTIGTAKIEFSPTSSKRVIVTMAYNGTLDSYVCFSGCTDTTNWVFTNNFVDVYGGTLPCCTPWDIEYEQTSGDIMIVYDYPETGSSAVDDLFYRIMTDSQTSFGSESTIDDSGNTATAGIYSFVVMDSQKTSGSDEMALIAIEYTGADASAIVWNGNDWTTLPQTELSTAVSELLEESVSITYETNSGDILVVAGEGATVRHNTFSNSGNNWGTSSTSTGTWAVGTLNWVGLVPDPRSTSNAIFLGGLGTANDIDSAYWSGSAWTDHAEQDAAITGNDKRYFDFAWDGSSLSGIFAWSTAANTISFTRGDPSSGTFGTDGTFTVDADGSTAQWITLVSNPTTADTVAALGLGSDGNSDISGIRWDGSTNNPASTGTDDISTSSANSVWEPFDIDFQKVPVRRSMSEYFNLYESISKTKTSVRSISDSMALSDAVARSIGFTRLTSEQMIVTDGIGKGISHLLSEQLALTDPIDRTIVTSRSMSEQLAATESAVRAFSSSRSFSEQLAVTETITKAMAVAMTEQLSVTDDLQRSILTVRSMTEQLVMTEALARIAVKSISVPEQLALTEVADRNMMQSIFMSDQLGATEFIAITVSKQITDNLTLSDTIMTAGSAAMAESMAITEAVVRSVIITRAVSDSLALSDTTSGVPTVLVIITEAMSIDDSFAEIALLISLDLGEALVLAQSFATDFAASFDQVDSEGIIIGDSVVLTLEPMGQVHNRNITESIGFQESALMLVMVPPPSPPSAIAIMPDLTMTETEDIDKFDGLTDPSEAVEVDGLWNMDSLDEQGLQSLLNSIGMPIYDVDLEAVSDDIDDLTMILPTFEVLMNVSGQISDDAIFLTPTLSNLPAGMQVIIPIDVQASMNGAGNLDHIGNMIVRFTPAESAGNTTILITLLDNSPEATTDDLPADMSAFYVDVSIVGDFGVITPSNSAFFEEQPEITFTITEEWAQKQDTDRDLNNVPIMGLFLLDESTGDWIEISSENIEPPTSAVGDVYTYTAILPHFSTYVITADEDGGSGESRGGHSSSEFTRSLTESLFVTSAMNTGAPIASEGKIIFKDIVDSLTLRAVQPQPLHQRVITIHDVTVAISIADVRSAATFGTALAALNFEIDNKGNTAEELMLRFWYSDPAGKMVYEAEQTITIGAGESIVEEVNIPFSSPDLYNVMIEVKSEDGTLSTTDIAVNVPWLTVYLYILIVIAIVVVVLSIAYVIYAMRRSGQFIIGGK